MLTVNTRYVLLQTMRGVYNGHTFYVDVVMDKEEDWFESFIWEENCGVKELLVTRPIQKDGRTANQIERFLERVENVFEKAADGYLKDRNGLRKEQ